MLLVMNLGYLYTGLGIIAAVGYGEAVCWFPAIQSVRCRWRFRTSSWGNFASSQQVMNSLNVFVYCVMASFS